MPLDQVTHSVALAALALGLRCPAGLYQGVLVGAQHLARFSAINVAMSLLAQGGAVLTLVWLSTDIRLYFAWQVGASLISVLWLRHEAWRSLGRRAGPSPDFKALAQLRRYSAAIAAVNVIGLCLTQLDKVLLSRMLSLTEYGQYTLATVAAGGLYVLISPVFNVVYPRFSTLAAQGRMVDLQRQYRLVSQLVAAAMFPLAMLLIVFGDGILALWTGNPGLATAVAPVLGLLSAGIGLHSVMMVVYALQLAMGASQLALKISLTLLLVQGPVIWLLTTTWGVIGAAAAWLVLHVLYLAIGAISTHRRFMPDITWAWLLQDVGAPLLLSSCAGLAGWYAAHDLPRQGPVVVLGGCALTVFVALAIIAASAQLRGLARSVWQRRVA